MTAIYSVGHGTASRQLFRTVLYAAEIAPVIDVRSRPYSRWNPQYSRKELSHSLAAWSIEYQLASKRTIALMCSESQPQDCHRKTTPSPAFQAHGLNVVHLLHDGTGMLDPGAGLSREPDTLF